MTSASMNLSQRKAACKYFYDYHVAENADAPHVAVELVPKEDRPFDCFHVADFYMLPAETDIDCAAARAQDYCSEMNKILIQGGWL